jgi:hypothetical protein
MRLVYNGRRDIGDYRRVCRIIGTAETAAKSDAASTRNATDARAIVFSVHTTFIIILISHILPDIPRSKNTTTRSRSRFPSRISITSPLLPMKTWVFVYPIAVCFADGAVLIERYRESNAVLPG